MINVLFLRSKPRIGRVVLSMLVLAFFLGFSCYSAEAVTRFGGGMVKGITAEPLDLKSIWFYNSDRSKTIPDVDLGWVTVVFYSAPGESNPGENKGPDEGTVLSQAEDLLDEYDDLLDYYYDRNLAEDACFFHLRSGISQEGLQYLLEELNDDENVAYALPTLKINGKTYAFFDAFFLRWKTSVSDEQKENLLSQAHASFDEEENMYRIDLQETSFFMALNLLAEDIRVSVATPYLVELKPSIQAALKLGINGMSMGENVPFWLVIAFSDRVSIDPSSIANLNLKPDTIQKELFDLNIDPYDYTKAITKSPIVITGRMRFYAPGEFVIPAVEVKYHCPSCSGAQDRSFATNPVTIKVASIVPSEQKGLDLIVPGNPLPIDWHLKAHHQKAIGYLWVAILSLLIALLGAVWWVRNTRAWEREQERLAVRGREEVLAEQLRLYLETMPAGPDWKYAAEAGDLLRQYLLYRYRISDGPSGGSGTVFFTAVKSGLPEAVARKAEALFLEIDKVIALEAGSYPDLARLKSAMGELMDLTSAPQ